LLVLGAVFAFESCSGSKEPQLAAMTAPAAEQFEMPSPRPRSTVAGALSGEHPFEADLLKIASEYLSWGRVDDEDRWAPEGCNIAVRQSPLTIGPAHTSESTDGATHGRKLYSIFARNRDDYLNVTEFTDVAIGQAIVKQSWISEEIKGKALKTSKQADLFIMMKLDPATPGTDAGWVYGTVKPDAKLVNSSGKIESCMNCHADARGDRLFGMPTYRQGAAITALTQLGCTFTLYAEEDESELDLVNYSFKNKERNRVEDRHLILLERVEELKQLWLDYSQVTDAGLDHLAKLSRLKELSLSHTQVGDTGLAKLRGLTGLQVLNLCDALVTNTGVAELQHALPNLKVMR
jgi:hypothetical protein